MPPQLKSWIQFLYNLSVSLTARPYHSQNERKERWRIQTCINTQAPTPYCTSLSLQPCQQPAVTNPSHSQNPKWLTKKSSPWSLLQPTCDAWLCWWWWWWWWCTCSPICTLKLYMKNRCCCCCWWNSWCNSIIHSFNQSLNQSIIPSIIEGSAFPFLSDLSWGLQIS